MAKNRSEEWRQYVETQFLACLLANGAPPEIDPEKDQFAWQHWERVGNYYEMCTEWLYPRMNYTPCKSESRERNAYIQRMLRLKTKYRGWLALQIRGQEKANGYRTT